MTNAKTSSLTGLKQRRIIGEVAFYVLGLLVAVIVCIPFYWMIITSLKGRGAIMSIPVEWIPKEPTLDAYKKLFAMPEFVGSIFILRVCSLHGSAASVCRDGCICTDKNSVQGT